MIEERSIAKKYAQALFEIDDTTERTHRLEEELGALCSIFEEQRELNDFFQFPTVSAKEKVNLALKIADSIGVSKDIRALIVLLTRRNRINLLALIHEFFIGITRQAEGIVEVRITTAVPVHEERADMIREHLEAYFKKKIKPIFQVDKSILGGFIAEGDWTVLDMSTLGQLRRFIEHF